MYIYIYTQIHSSGMGLVREHIVIYIYTHILLCICEHSNSTNLTSRCFNRNVFGCQSGGMTVVQHSAEVMQLWKNTLTCLQRLPMSRAKMVLFLYQTLGGLQTFWGKQCASRLHQHLMLWPHSSLQIYLKTSFVATVLWVCTFGLSGKRQWQNSDLLVTLTCCFLRARPPPQCICHQMRLEQIMVFPLHVPQNSSACEHVKTQTIGDSDRTKWVKLPANGVHTQDSS